MNNICQQKMEGRQEPVFARIEHIDQMRQAIKGRFVVLGYLITETA